MYIQARYICVGFCPNRKLIGHAQYDVSLKLETFLITCSVLKTVTRTFMQIIAWLKELQFFVDLMPITETHRFY